MEIIIPIAIQIHSIHAHRKNQRPLRCSLIFVQKSINRKQCNFIWLYFVPIANVRIITFYSKYRHSCALKFLPTHPLPPPPKPLERTNDLTPKPSLFLPTNSVHKISIQPVPFKDYERTINLLGNTLITRDNNNPPINPIYYHYLSSLLHS